MRQWTEWETVRHQVAVAGRVVDGEEGPVGGAEVTLTTLPKQARQRRADVGADRQELDEPCDRTFTKPDGIFFFLDSPAGEYAVECLNGRAGLRDKKTVSVSWRQDGTVEKAATDLKLSKA